MLSQWRCRGRDLAVKDDSYIYEYHIIYIVWLFGARVKVKNRLTYLLCGSMRVDSHCEKDPFPDELHVTVQLRPVRFPVFLKKVDMTFFLKIIFTALNQK